MKKMLDSWAVIITIEIKQTHLVFPFPDVVFHSQEFGNGCSHSRDSRAPGKWEPRIHPYNWLFPSFQIAEPPKLVLFSQPLSKPNTLVTGRHKTV